MKNELMIFTAGILIGVFVVSFVSDIRRAPVRMESDIEDEASMEDAMHQMTNSLEHKTGDDFDRVFIEEMILHHEGAVKMAEQAKQQALHQELKDMSDAIISAQTSEINQLRLWQKEWGYEK